jgi:hypothetical protein
MGKFIARGAYTKNIEKSQIMLYLKLLEKQEQSKPKTSRRKEIIKIRAYINERETRKTIQKTNEMENWIFVSINKIDKFLANLTKMRREKTQISKIRNKKGEIIVNNKEIIRDYFESLYSKKLENLEKKKDKFLDMYDHLKVNQEDSNHLNRSITSNDIKAVIKNLHPHPPKKDQN